MHDLLVGAVSFLMGFLVCARVLIQRFPQTVVTEVPIEVTQEENAAVITPMGEFAVDRNPRKPSWRDRKREIEASHRTKRKMREEFRD